MRKLSLVQLAALALRRSGGYKRLFKEGNAFRPDAEVVLADLRRFCRADGTSTYSDNPQRMALLEGRREVFERIMAYIQANDADIHRLHEQVPQDT